MKRKHFCNVDIYSEIFNHSLNNFLCLYPEHILHVYVTIFNTTDSKPDPNKYYATSKYIIFLYISESAAAAQPDKVRQSCSATDLFIFI
jgi:hypothetical protein